LATHPQGIDLDVITNFRSHPPTWNPDASTPPQEGWSYSAIKWGMAEEGAPSTAPPNRDIDGNIFASSVFRIYEWDRPEHWFMGMGYGVTTETWDSASGITISRRITEIALPFWLTTSLLVIPGLLAWRRTVLRRSRLRSHRCLSCGYDLRGSPERCPECGRIAPSPAASIQPS